EMLGLLLALTLGWHTLEVKIGVPGAAAGIPVVLDRATPACRGAAPWSRNRLRPGPAGREASPQAGPVAAPPRAPLLVPRTRPQGGSGPGVSARPDVTARALRRSVPGPVRGGPYR